MISMWNGWLGGLFVWAVPFAASCCVIAPDPESGQMVKTLSPENFRNLMMATGALASAWATRKCDPKTRAGGIALAAKFLAVNWLMDLLVLVPLMVPEATGQQEVNAATWRATVPYWFRNVGASYSAFVVSCIVAGDSAERAAAPKSD